MKRLFSCIIVGLLTYMTALPAHAGLLNRQPPPPAEATPQGADQAPPWARNRQLKSLVQGARGQRSQREKLKNSLMQGAGVDRTKSSVRLTLPFVSKQHDGWSCGLHCATRLLKFKRYEVDYEELKLQRKLSTLMLKSDQGPYTLPHALQNILRNWHKDSWWLNGVTFDVVKDLLRQNKPVAVLTLLKGQSFKLNIGTYKIKAPGMHWLVASGFDDSKKILYYYDPYKEGEQQASYKQFLEVWDFEPSEFIRKGFDPLLLTYGFIASRAIAFCN